MMNNLSTDVNIKGVISTNDSLKGSIKTKNNLIGKMSSSGSGGVSEIYVNDIEQDVNGRRADITIEYNTLPDRPLVNDEELIGGVNNGYFANSRITNTELEEIFSDW